MVGVGYPNAWFDCFTNTTLYPDRPAGRMHASLARVVVNGSDAAVLLGGLGAGNSVLDDAWLLVFDSVNLDTSFWPTCGWKRLTVAGDMPLAMDAVPLAHVPPGHLFLRHDLIMFGGCEGGIVSQQWRTRCLKKSNAVVAADLDANTLKLTFTHLFSAGTALPNVSLSQLIVSHDAVHILGGFTVNGTARGPRTAQSMMMPTAWRATAMVNSTLQWEELSLPEFYGQPSAVWDEENQAILLAGVLFATSTTKVWWELVGAARSFVDGARGLDISVFQAQQWIRVSAFRNSWRP